MPSLKEVKNRISTVTSTRKITSAMKMVASSKLHHAQKAIEGMHPYEQSLEKMMRTFVANYGEEVESPYVVKRPVKRVAIVVYCSNSSLCGAFNSNVIKAFNKAVERYKSEGKEVVKVLVFGKKAEEAVRKLNVATVQDHSRIMDAPTYAAVVAIGQELMADYVDERVDEVLMIYHHFKSSSTQVLTEELFLPVSLNVAETPAVNDTGHYALDYIVEPNPKTVLAELIPKSLTLKIYTAALDSLASEHAARVIAMQVATDNADDLLHELKLAYNKTRQQAITNELLDIVAGSAQ